MEITELICEFCPEFANDSTLFELRSGHNSRITKLVLGNGTVTDSGVDHIIASPFASALRKIDLRRNNEVTQSGYIINITTSYIIYYINNSHIKQIWQIT